MSEEKPPQNLDSGRLPQLTRHQQALLELAAHRDQARDLAVSLHVITEIAARTLDVGRASVWLFDDDRTQIHCVDMYSQATGRHEDSAELLARDYPTYFRALEKNRALAADDALADERTAELSEHYLRPSGITSMLDAPIRQDGVIVGIACHEHTGPMRTWTLEERNFAGSIADMCALTIERSGRRQAEEEIRRRDALLDGVAKAANRMFADTERVIARDEAMLTALADLTERVLASSDPLSDVESFLRVVGTTLNVSRISVYAEHPHVYSGASVLSERGRWAPDSSGSPLDLDVSWRERGLERWRLELSSGRAVGGVVSLLPEDERPTFEVRFVRSVLGIPIVISGDLWGYVELSDQSVDRDWTLAERSFAIAASGIIGMALAR